MRIVLASKNNGKLKEINQILKSFIDEVDLVSLSEYEGIEQPVEDGCSFFENSLIKAKSAATLTGEIALADDSGLIVDVLGGAPGIRSARFGGDDLSDTQRCDLLLSMLEGVPYEARTARFMCVMTMCTPTGEVLVSCGTCEGHIDKKAQGANGFGYDPVFVVKETGMSMAMMDESKKNILSHRYIALKKMSEHIKNIMRR